MPPHIVILTDFGSQDPFVGIMKGVIVRTARGVPTIDLTHEVPPGDIRRAAVILWQSVPYFPADTIFLVVVDPGVGTDRRPVFVKGGDPGPIFIGPDNGVFTFASRPSDPAWELRNPDLIHPNPSQTFHGRDLFAPAAAYAARGITGNQFGPPALERVQLPKPRLGAIPPGILAGEILYADRFGNLLTSLGRFVRQGQQMDLDPWLPDTSLSGIPARLDPRRVQLLLPGDRRIPLVQTFRDVPSGQAAGLVGSSGLIEIVANQQSAAELLGLSERTPVELAVQQTS